MGLYAVTENNACQLHSMLDEQTNKVEALTAELWTAQQMLIDKQASSREEDTEIAALQDLPAKEKQCVLKDLHEKHKQLSVY